MRPFSVLLVVAGISSAVVGFAHNHNPLVKRRKTLGFGPALPHAVFHSSPFQVVTNNFLPMSQDANPFDVAQQFLEDILGDRLSDSNTFVIREDSYTDKNTGVTHVYVRQIVNGLEVADGDINLNIKDGFVLSFGNSVRDSKQSVEIPDFIHFYSYVVLPWASASSFRRCYSDNVP
jgi:extracellular elastinolytic metalloproteinase